MSGVNARIKTTRSDKWVGRQITCSARSIYGGIVVYKYSTRRHVIIGKSNVNDRPPYTLTRHITETGPKEEYSPTLEGTRQNQRPLATNANRRRNHTRQMTLRQQQPTRASLLLMRILHGFHPKQGLEANPRQTSINRTLYPTKKESEYFRERTESNCMRD